jgi:hypothetical protein
LLLVAELVVALAEPPAVLAPLAPAPELEPAVERLLAADPFAPVPPLAAAAVPVVTTAPIPVVEVVLALFGTALTAVTPVVVPPTPLTVPAVAAPPLAVAVVGAEPVGFVLVRVVSDVVVVLDVDVAVLGVVASCSFGSVTAPVPTCPPPSVPGAALVAGVVVVVCAATGSEIPSDTITTRDKIVFKSRPQGRVAEVPDRGWRCR